MKHEKKREKSKRNFWLTSEIGCMLSLVKEELSKSPRGTTTTLYTFVVIANKMKKRGHPNKSAQQIRRKWFQLKSAYLCYKRKGNAERLQLIPEQYRNELAALVDTDYRATRLARIMRDALPVSTKPLTTCVGKRVPAPVKHEPASPLETPKIEPKSHKTPQEPPKLEVPTYEDDYNKAPFTQPEEPEEPYESAFANFVGRIKVTHTLLNRDFRRMQESLMNFEHHNQAIRDDMMMSFLRSGQIGF